MGLTTSLAPLDAMEGGCLGMPVGEWERDVRVNVIGELSTAALTMGAGRCFGMDDLVFVIHIQHGPHCG